MSILLISNYNTFRVLFNETASIYFIWKIYVYFSIENASQGNQHCANCIGTLLFPIATQCLSVTVIEL